MSDEKLALLRQSHTLHPHPDAVRDPLFTSGSPFFDARDLVQVKYELLRRVRVDGYAVSEATALFWVPTFLPPKIPAKYCLPQMRINVMQGKKPDEGDQARFEFVAGSTKDQWI